MKNALIIMLKNPVKGKVKTRLAKDVGEDKAMDVYMKLLACTKEVTQNIEADRFLFYSDTVERSDIFPENIYKKYTQCSGHLGLRMDYAFSIPFKNEYKNVVMIGTDCYELKPGHINTAFEKLNDHDFVIGPAHDGGYYLIAMKKWNRWLFENKSWSTEKLFEETKNEIISRNGKLFELEKLTDIDTAEDLKKSGIAY